MARLDAVEMIDAAHAGGSTGSTRAAAIFSRRCPTDYVREAVARLPVRAHQDIVLSPQMLVERASWSCYCRPRRATSSPAGGPRRRPSGALLFSPRSRAAHRRGAGRVADPDAHRRTGAARAGAPHPFRDAQAAVTRSRAPSRVRGIERLAKPGIRCSGARAALRGRGRRGRRGPALPDRRRARALLGDPRRGRAGERQTAPLDAPRQAVQQHGHRARDPLTGAGREDVLLSAEDARRLGLAEGDAVLLRSDAGEMRGRCRVASIAPGNVQSTGPGQRPARPRGPRPRVGHPGL